MTNRLAGCSSPYLRQHQDNPVDWYPWCEEAFARASSEDKPVFLSVGYSACHWCHVMEHESFQDERIAEILNGNFVSIKVDREERPDVDQVYMQAVQMLTGSGGWPMSVFLSHDGKPFYAGTYWPPESRWGRPGFGQVLLAVSEAWKNKRDQITEQSEQITAQLQSSCRGPQAADASLNDAWIKEADRWLLQHHDPQHGGFGDAPKFPHAMDLMLWIDLSAQAAATRDRAEAPSREQSSESEKVSDIRTQAILRTLDHMARGGIYDHLGGGFARYSVDKRWLVPHFEKMLYDNALLASTYAHAYRLWGNDDHAQVIRETLDYIVRDMTHPEGGFFSTEDADSEGVEGKFYVWTPEEIRSALGEERAHRFCLCFDVTEGGNFEGSNILNLPKSIQQFCELRQLDESEVSQELLEDRFRLLEARNKRVRPGLDDKVLVSWNALMIRAMLDGYRALGESKYLSVARRALDFLTRNLRRQDGQWWHSWRNGQAEFPAFLDDYGYMIDALVELFQVDGRLDDLKLAIELAEVLLEHFQDPSGGFYFTADDHEPLIARSKDLADSSVPSGNAMAASGLLTLARLTGREDFREACGKTLVAMSGVMEQAPQAAAQALRVLNRWLHPGAEYVLLLDETASDNKERGSLPDNSIERRLLSRLEPASLVLIHRGPVSDELQTICPLLKDRFPRMGATLFVCRDFVCDQPMSGAQARQFLAKHSESSSGRTHE